MFADGVVVRQSLDGRHRPHGDVAEEAPQLDVDVALLQLAGVGDVVGPIADVERVFFGALAVVVFECAAAGGDHGSLVHDEASAVADVFE